MDGDKMDWSIARSTIYIGDLYSAEQMFDYDGLPQSERDLQKALDDRSYSPIEPGAGQRLRVRARRRVYGVLRDF